MDQKALFDFEADEDASGVRRVFGQVLFIASFVFLFVTIIWFLIPLIDTAIAPAFDMPVNHASAASGGGAYITYIPANDDPIVDAGEGAVAAYTRWEAEHAVNMRLQFEPIWAGFVSLLMSVFCMFSARVLSYRARIAFDSPTRVALFAGIVVVILAIISVPMLMFSVTTGAYESLPVWMALVFGAIFGVILGWAWWRQAKLSGKCISAGYVYDGGWGVAGMRARTPVLYWIDENEKIADIDFSTKEAVPVADMSVWAEEDRNQQLAMIAATASKTWLSFR